jgi:hypothetical protein
MSDDSICEKLNSIEERLVRIENMLIENKQTSFKLNNHIDFIDSVYDTVKRPLSRILYMYNQTSISNIDKSKLIK